MFQNESSSSEQLQRLNKISQKLNPKTPISDIEALSKEYATIYVMYHHRDEDYFVAICEHRFLQNLILHSSKSKQQTYVLECLNLIITNTSNPNELTYFLAQNCLHSFLFQNGLQGKSTEYIEYFIQLIKTLLLKINDGKQNKKYLRMFCNQKYPSFPIFTYSALLACEKNQMVRITAQQCVLVLVRMIKNMRGYQNYLVQPVMIFLVFQLSVEFCKLNSDRQGITKYFSDLLFELANNDIPLLIMSNIMANVIIVSNFPYRIKISLEFIEMITNQLQVLKKQNEQILENQQGNVQNQYQQEFSEESRKQVNSKLSIVCETFYKILANYMTSNFLNPIYFSAYTLLCSQAPHEQPFSLLVTTPQSKQMWKIIQNYSIKKYIEQTINTNKININENENTIQILNMMTKLFAKCADIQKIKSKYFKYNQNSITNIFNSGPVEGSYDFVKYVCLSSSINLNKGESVFSNLNKIFVPSTAPFIVEFFKNQNIAFEQSEENSCYQLFNLMQDQWTFTPKFMQTVLSIYKTNQQQKQHPRLIFTEKLKKYLEQNAQRFLCPDFVQKITLLPDLITFAKLCSIVKVNPSNKTKKHIAKYLVILQRQLQQIMHEQGFQGIHEYLKMKNQLKQLKNTKENTQKTIKVKSSLCFKSFCAFCCVFGIWGGNGVNFEERVWRAWGDDFDKETQSFWGKCGSLGEINDVLGNKKEEIGNHENHDEKQEVKQHNKEEILSQNQEKKNNEQQDKIESNQQQQNPPNPPLQTKPQQISTFHSTPFISFPATLPPVPPCTNPSPCTLILSKTQTPPGVHLTIIQFSSPPLLSTPLCSLTLQKNKQFSLTLCPNFNGEQSIEICMQKQKINQFFDVVEKLKKMFQHVVVRSCLEFVQKCYQDISLFVKKSLPLDK